MIKAADERLAEFASELRAWRAHAGLSQVQFAAQIPYSAGLVALIETGERTPSGDFAALCDTVFGAPGVFTRIWERLRELPYPASFRSFAPSEARASALRTFQHSLVPGLVQTPEYARAVLATRPGASAAETDTLVAARMERQGVLSRDDPPMLWALLDESALLRPAAPPEVMRGQLLHLAGEERVNVSIQVVPYSAGAHSGLLGAFVLADPGGIVFLEDAGGGRVSEAPSEVAEVALLFEALRSEALPKGVSRDLIERVVKEKWT